MHDSESTRDARFGEAERLLEEYVAGDTAAFEGLVDLYQDRLYRFAERMTGDAHLAEDVLQTTFLKVAEKAGEFDGRASFSTWLFRIARNTAIDEMRGRRRRLQFSDAGTEDRRLRPGGEGDPSPLERMEKEELLDAVRKLLAAVPENQREAFLLKEEAELGFQEIGEVLGCGRETAKSRFRLAVEKLRGGLSRMGWNRTGRKEGDA